MPKKITTNTKSVEAKERKAAVKRAKADEEEKRKEDAKWIDHDKALAKKQDRKADEVRKKDEQLRKKQEAKAQLEAEEKSLRTTAKITQTKLTRAQIDQEVKKRNRNIETINNPNGSAKINVVKEIPLEENYNRVMVDFHFAHDIDEAIKVFKCTDREDEDKHPEKRMKAAFRAYEDDQLPIVKKENSSLKLSQHKQIIFKNWQQAPENPMNKS